MKKYSYIIALLLVTPLLFTSCEASKRSRPERDISEFTGDKLIIGRGHTTHPLGFETTNLEQYYTIDLNKRLFPCKRANGLDADTYATMPDELFTEVCFEHMSFSPIYNRYFCTMTGYSDMKKDSYSSSNWQTLTPLTEEARRLPSEIFRILRPGGTITFKSFVMKDLEIFRELNIYSEQLQDELPIGLSICKRYYEEAGFKNPIFKSQQHETYGGWFIQMSASKPRKERRKNKVGSDDNLTEDDSL